MRIDEGFGDRPLGQAGGFGIEDVEQQPEPRSLERRGLVARRLGTGRMGKPRSRAEPDRHGRIDGQGERERCVAAPPLQGEAMPAMIVVGDEILLVRRPLPEGNRLQMVERERRIGRRRRCRREGQDHGCRIGPPECGRGARIVQGIEGEKVTPICRRWRPTAPDRRERDRASLRCARDPIGIRDCA